MSVVAGKHDGHNPRRRGGIGRVFRAPFERRVIIVDPEADGRLTDGKLAARALRTVLRGENAAPNGAKHLGLGKSLAHDPVIARKGGQAGSRNDDTRIAIEPESDAVVELGDARGGIGHTSSIRPR